MTKKINMSILDQYYMYLLCIYILTIIKFFISFLFIINWFILSMNMYANQYNNLQLFLPKILDMNKLLISYITTTPSFIERQIKCISLQKILFQTQPLVIHQQMGHKSYSMILYLGQVLFCS